MVDSVKHDLRSYLKKQRKKPVPSGATYWGFDCKVGLTEDVALDTHLSSLMSRVDELVADNAITIYVELIPKAITATAKQPNEEN